MTSLWGNSSSKRGACEARGCDVAAAAASPHDSPRKRTRDIAQTTDGPTRPDKFSITRDNDATKFHGTISTIVSKDVYIFFDGACRGVDLTVGAAVLMDQQVPYYGVKQSTDARTPTQAELLGLEVALQITHTVLEARLREKNTSPTTIRIFGDSAHVIAEAESGAMAALGRLDRPSQDFLQKINNHDFLTACGKRMVAIATLFPFAQLTFAFHRRKYNAAPDEVCKAFLDGRDPGPLKRVAKTPFAPSILNSCCSWSCRRFLPRELWDEWRRVVLLLIPGSAAEATDTDWKLLLFAPRLLLSFLRRGDYIRHLASLRTKEDILDYLSDLTPETRPQRHDTDLQTTITKFFTENHPGKALDHIIAPSSIAAPTQGLATKFWPRADTPQFQIIDRVVNPTVDFDLLHLIARRKLKANKAADLGGWTKELLNAVGVKHFAVLLQAVMRGDANSTVVKVVTADKGIMIQQESGKIRPAAITSIWCKLLWHHAFARTRAARLPCQLPAAPATAALSMFLRHSPVVIKTDCSNAFHSLDRAAIKEAIVAQNLTEIIPLWNLFYGKRTQIVFPDQAKPPTEWITHSLTRGTRAGCVSGTLLFELGIARSLSRIQELGKTLAVVDDIYVAVQANAGMLERIGNILKDAGLTLNVAKSKIIDSGNVNELKLGTWMDVAPVVPPEVVLARIREPLSKVLASDVKLHYKYHLVDMLFRRQIYGLRHLTCSNSLDIASKVSVFWRETVQNLVGGEIPDLLFQASLEDGGLAGGFDAFPQAWMKYNARHANLYTRIFEYPHMQVELEGTLNEKELRKEYFMTRLKDVSDVNGCAPHYLLAYKSHEKRAMEDWLAQIPNYQWCLPDENFKAAMLLRCYTVPHGFKRCDRDPGPEDSRWDHAMKCKVCSNPVLRHNIVLDSIARTLRSRGIVVTTNTNRHPLPKTIRDAAYVDRTEENSVMKGPDAEIYVEDLQCIDVVVTTPWKGKARCPLLNVYNEKVTLYKEWTEFYKMKCHPVAVSAFGHVHTATRAVFESWEKSLHMSSLCFDIIRAINRSVQYAITNPLIIAMNKTKVADLRSHTETDRTTARHPPVATAPSPAPQAHVSTDSSSVPVLTSSSSSAPPVYLSSPP